MQLLPQLSTHGRRLANLSASQLCGHAIALRHPFTRPPRCARRQSASQHPARPAPAPASRQGSAATSRQASGTVGAAPQHPSVPPSAAATPAAQTFGFPIEYRGERSSDMFVNAGTKTTGPANAKGAAAGSSGNNAPGHHTQPRSEAQRAADASGLLHRVYGGIKALSPVKPVDKKASPRSRSSNQAPANKKQQQQPARRVPLRLLRRI